MTRSGWADIADDLAGALRHGIDAHEERHKIVEAADDWVTLTERYFAEELLARYEVDSAARLLAQENRFPTGLSTTARYYLAVRIYCAIDFLGQLYPVDDSPSPFDVLPPGWSHQRAVEWLLVDLWIRRHDHWLKLNAIGVCGPFPFYGIFPAE